MYLPRPFYLLQLFLPAIILSADALPPLPGDYRLTQITTSGSPNGFVPINSFGQVVGQGGFLWTPMFANAPIGNVVKLPGANASAINSRGQVVGQFDDESVDLSFLWSPDMPNGTSGSSVTLPVRGVATGINSFGQVIGGSFLWTPLAPNGSTGTVNSDARFNGVAAINDFGQVILNPVGSAPLLFTPSKPNGGTGTFTQLTGLDKAVAINNNGTIVGTYCVYDCRSFLWTPASPNATTGTLSEIPAPAGMSPVSPVAMNDSGDVVGSLCSYTCRTTFLYRGGAFYDLSVYSYFGGVTGINNAGQVVFGGNGTSLLTPVSPPAQSGVPVTIASLDYGRGFIASGSGCSPGAYTAQQTLNWTPGSSCTVTFLSPQSDSIFSRYRFKGWQDGSAANPRTFTAPSQAATYTALFQLQYFLTAAANPPEGGAVAGGGWYDTQAVVAVTQTAATGYRFESWSLPNFTTSTSPGASVNMYWRETVTANFRRVLDPSLQGSYAVMKFPTICYGQAADALNNYGQVACGSLWTPTVANGTSGTFTDLGFQAAVVNDLGEVAGAVPGFSGSHHYVLSKAMLWLPVTPNATAGGVVPILGDGSLAEGINNYGQVIGENSEVCIPDEGDISNCYYPGSALWTPLTPNGAIGAPTSTLDQAWLGQNHFVGLNNFGQAITPTQLYRPPAANGGGGTFTDIHGLDGSTMDQLIAINDRGVIAGTSNLCPPASPCNRHGFLWTPSTPNGTQGTAVEIPLPAGFVAMSPAALNAQGDVVGSMTESGTATTNVSRSRPFLFRNGAVLDLGSISAEFANGAATAINDRGQVLVSGYLLTPQVTPPSPVEVIPRTGTGRDRVVQFTFEDPRGWQDIGVVNVLINDFLDGRHACYIAFSRPLNTVYLVNDNGDGLSAPLILNGSGSVSNSQCTIRGQGSSVSGNASLLFLMLNVSFSQTFGGNKVVYIAARDVAENNSGWQPMGTWSISPTQQLPSISPVSPLGGIGSTGLFSFAVTDFKGASDVGVVNILVNHSLDGRQACYLAYSQPLNVLYLVNDAGTGLLPGLRLGSRGILSNSQCAVPMSEVLVSMSANGLNLNLQITFAGAFSGNHVVYAAARDVADSANSGWQAVGSWSVR